MKKVLIISGALSLGGVERLILDTAKALIKRGNYLPTVLNLSGEGSFEDELKRSGIECVSLNQGVLRKNVMTNLRKTREFIKSRRPDIIHTHQFASDFYGGLGTLGLHIPVVSHLHNIDAESPSRQVVRTILGCLSIIDVFIATTEKKYDELKKVLRPGRVFLLYNAFDPQNLELPKGFSKAGFRSKLSIPKNNFVIGGVGRLSREKGYDVLLSAFKNVLLEMPKTSLVLVGDGLEMDNLKELAYDLVVAANVIFTGYRKDTAALMSIFDVFVISSRMESFSLVALEAMFVGVPVIITDRLSSKDLFAPAAVTVPLSPEGMGNGIISLLGDKKKREILALKGNELVKNRFTIDAYITKVEAIYDKLLTV